VLESACRNGGSVGGRAGVADPRAVGALSAACPSFAAGRSSAVVLVARTPRCRGTGDLGFVRVPEEEMCR
jgi:hypothetical protein